MPIDHAKPMIRIIAFAFLTLTLAACSDEPPVEVWRFALEEIPGSVQDAYAQKFKQLVEQRSGGDVQVEVYPYGALGTSANLTEQVQNGALQLAFASPGHLGSVVPEVQVFSLHFLFPRDEDRIKELLAADPTLYRELDAAYREHGLDLLAIVPEGWMVWTGDRALRAPGDFAGFKMRTMVSPLLIAAYEAYGASPTPMPYAEVYSGLQLNMIDGQVNPVFAIEEMSFYEVQEVMTFADHLPFIATVVANPAFVDGLSEPRRKLLAEVKAELDDYIFGVQKGYNAERLEKIRKESDIAEIRLSEAEREVFRSKALPVREVYLESAGERGGRLLEAIEAYGAPGQGTQADAR